MAQKDRILTAEELDDIAWAKSDPDLIGVSIAQDRKTVRAMDEWLEKRVDDPAEMLRPVRQGALIATLKLFKDDFGVNDEI